MIPSAPLFHKPKAIIAAKNLLFATIFLGIIDWIVGKIDIGLSNYFNPKWAMITALILIVLYILTRQIGLGRKWARTVLLILCIPGIILLVFVIISLFTSNLPLGVLFILQVILLILALKFLFSRDSTSWFNRVHSTIPEPEAVDKVK